MTTRIAFNVARRRPGCVLIQAALCPDWTPAERDRFTALFGSETWLVGLDGMAVYEATDAQWERLAVMAAAAVREA